MVLLYEFLTVWCFLVGKWMRGFKSYISPNKNSNTKSMKLISDRF